VTATFSIKRSGRHSAADAPTWARTILEGFRAEDIRNLVFLPDTVMGRLLAVAEEDPFFRLVGVHREEEAVGILTGLFLGGQRGAMLIQSSGLGNTLNALGSLAMAYHIPFPLLVSLRGELGEFNPAQLHMGRAVPGCLDALTIDHVTLRTEIDLATVVSGALKTCYTAEEPFGILLSAQLSGWKPEK
jgi:sulfopyruvate decarboxylase subunit alpha